MGVIRIPSSQGGIRVTQSKQIYFKPPEGCAGDFIPFYHDGLFYLYYLRDIRSPRGHFDGVPWCLTITPDFVNFTDCGVVLEPGGFDDQDLMCYTGCVCQGPDAFHMYYEGMNPRMRARGKPEQGFMHAVSDDLIHWRKLPGTFFSPDGYEDHDWRDPFVFYEESDGRHHMLMAGRSAKGPKTRRGLTAHLVSDNLYDWTVLKPLWAPESYYTHECPDLFQIGEWRYHLFSEFTDACRTRYVMAKSLDGPWISPKDDVFDTRGYYAAKTWSDGKKRYLFGWNPTRQDGDDMKDFQWGGSLTVHEVFQRDDGTLAVREPESIRAAWGAGEPLQVEGKTGEVRLDRADGMAIAYADSLAPKAYRMSGKVSFTEGTRELGLLLRADPESDTAYGLFFSPAMNRLRFDALPEPHWNQFRTRGLDRLTPMMPGRPMDWSLIVDDTVATLYVDGQVALSTRMYSLKGTRLGFFCQHGAASFADVRVSISHPALQG
jgi:beta-fructofuranosidase